MALEAITSNIFVILPEATEDGSIIVGKNSRKPQNEVQEVIYVQGGVREGTQLKCTYIEIDESTEAINSVILSKPSWMWGAEMGSNNKNVFIAKESCSSSYSEGDCDPNVKRLMAADLVRLGLERGGSAEQALSVITELLEKYGQGGPCALNSDKGSQSKFIIADSSEAWVLETVGKFWVAEKIKEPRTAFSNKFDIHSSFHKSSDGIQDIAKSLNLWNGEGEFDFAKCFGQESTAAIGEDVLKESNKSSFSVSDMFEILRNDIFADQVNENYSIQSCQVSQLNSSTVSVHWFTGTPDAKKSIFKPFIFTADVKLSKHIICPTEEDKPHNLYLLHQKKIDNDSIREILRKLEADCVTEVSIFRQDFSKGSVTLDEVVDLMKDSVDAERDQRDRNDVERDNTTWLPPSASEWRLDRA